MKMINLIMGCERKFAVIFCIVLLLAVVVSVGGLMIAFAVEDFSIKESKCIVIGSNVSYYEYDNDECYFGTIYFAANATFFSRKLNIPDLCACPSKKKVANYINNNFPIGKSFACYLSNTITFSQPNKIFNLILGIIFLLIFLTIPFLILYNKKHFNYK